MAGRLFVVATPIGCLEDITLRALRVLKEADGILAEDTRRTRALCAHHGITSPLRSFHAHSADVKVERIAQEIAEGARLALVTDAGTPLISDPGGRLVRACAEGDLPVEVVPGPSAVTAALSVAAIPTDSFRFVGFLPRSGGRRRRALERIASDPSTSVIFEAPGRIAGTLRDLAPHLGPDRRVAVCRELTKVHEEVLRGSAEALAAKLQEGARGEITVVIEGASREAPTVPDEEALAEAIATLRAEGLSARDAAHRLARETGLSRRDAYQRVQAAWKSDPT